MTTVFKVQGASKRFGGLQALTDVSMSIEQGQVYGLIGPNGAGKTTFFNVITGLYTPDGGTFELGGPLQPRPPCTRWPRPASRAPSRTSGCLPR
jgi:branched-chain amino acid transport system ATP-binding protein